MKRVSDLKREGSSQCMYCGRLSHKEKSECPASGQTCKKCVKKDYFARVCRSEERSVRPEAKTEQPKRPWVQNEPIHARQVRHLESEKIEVSAYEFMRYKKMGGYGVMEIDEVAPRKNNGPRAWIKVCESNVNFLIDTGAPINVIYVMSFPKFEIKPEIKRCNTEYFGYKSNQPLPIIG